MKTITTIWCCGLSRLSKPLKLPLWPIYKAHCVLSNKVSFYTSASVEWWDEQDKRIPQPHYSKYTCHCPETQASWRSKASMIKTWNILHQRATPLKTQINNHSILGNKLADLLSFFKCVTATKTVGSKWITQASLWDIHYFTGKSCACSFDVSLRVFQGTFMSQREVDFYMKVTLKVETFTDGFLFSLPLKMFSVMISFFIVLTHCILFHCKIHASTFNCI